MWNDLLFSVNTVFPLLVLMVAGFAARRFGVIGEDGVKQANKAVFFIFLPLLLCLNIMDTPLNVTPDYKTLLFAMVAVVFSFVVLFIIAPHICPAPASRGVFIQGIARSNYAIFGIPLVLMMYPDADTSVSALMVVAVVPIFNIISTIALMTNNGQRVNFWSIVKGVLLNPLIIGTLGGFALWLLHWHFPTIVQNPLDQLASIATPLALFLLGASLDFGKVQANARLLTIGVLGRLVVLPLVCLSVAVAIGIRGVSLATLIAVFASPTAVSSYPMAQQLGGDTDFAAAQVVLTTTFSGVSVFIWIFLFKSLGLVG
ncbi:MAG: AEC family transporter [Eubacteriales bacterium]|nr:AEC family transporter [Eubacteriales bacterium]